MPPPLWILLAALLFSTGGAAIKFVTLAPIQVAVARSAIACVFLLVASREARRRPTSYRPLLVALAFAATMLLFVLATRATTAANAVFLQASAPLFVLVLAPLLLREPLTRRDVVTLVGMGLGVACFFGGEHAPSATAPDPGLGDLLGALGGLTWGLSIVGLRWVGRERAGTLQVVVYGNAGVVLLALPFVGAFPEPSTGDALVLLWLGAFQIGAAYLFVARGIRGVPALTASLLFLIEPVLNPIWTFLVHGEKPSPLAILGGVLILGFALRSAWLVSRDDSTPGPG